MSKRFGARAVVVALVAAAACVIAPVTPASATFSELGPKCSSSGLLGIQVDGAAPLGTYALTGVPGRTVTITKSTGKVFDWTSTFGLERVIVQSAAGSRTYTYADGTSGTALVAPKLLGRNTTIASVRFCYDGRDTPTTSASTDTVAGARGVAIGDIPLTALPASLLNRVAGADLVNDAGTGLRFSGSSPNYAGTGLRFSGTGLRFSGTGLRFSPTPEVAGTGLRFSGTSLRFSGTGLRFSGTGLRFSGTGLRFSGDGIGTLVNIRSAGTGLRFSGTGLRFSGTGLRFSELPAWDVPLSELQPPAGYSWNDVFVAVGTYQGFPPQNVTFGQLLDELDLLSFGSLDDVPPVIAGLASMSLLDLDPNGNVLRNVSLVGLLLGNTRLVDIPLPAGSTWCAIIDPAFAGCNDADIGDATVLALNLAGLRSDNLPLDAIALGGVALDTESVLADLLADDDGDDLYVPAQAGDTLASYLVRGIDALNVPWEQLDLATGFDVRQYAFGAPVTFTSSWSQVGPGATDIVATVPSGFVPAPGSPTCTTSAGSCTVTQSGTGPTTFRVQTTGSTSFQTIGLQLSYRPSGLVGAGAPTGGSFSVDAGSAEARSFAVAVTDPWSGQSPPPVEPDVLYFATAAGGAIDAYDVDVSGKAPGSHVAVRVSNLTDDADLVLYRSAGTGLRFSGTGMRFSGTGLRFSGTGLRFSGGNGDESVSNRESETLEDVPIDQSLLVEDVSATRAGTPEVAEGFTALDTSTFRIQVSGFNEANTDYVMRIAVTEFSDSCPATPRPTTTVAFSGNAAADTIVVYPRDRFAAAEQATIDAALGRLDGFWPGGVQRATVSTSGSDWTTEQGSCSVFAANAVAEDVAAALQAQTADGTVEHVMLIGGDDKLPMYRSPDTTLIANESNYVSTIGGRNALTAALATQHLLTDDIYGDSDPWPFLNRLYFTPDRAVGRLVESAADIAGQIDRFVAAEGRIDVDRAFTAGYDFLSDAALEIDENLAAVTGNRDTLISDVPGGTDDWTSAQLADGLRAGDNGGGLKVASINAHMDQGLLLSAAGDAQGANPSASEVVRPEVVIPSGVNGAVMFTAGCHAGLNQPYTSAARTDSWSKSLAGGAAAVYLANTGYGYGLDQPVIGYSEELLAGFSDLLEIGGSTVGQAAAYAKQQYFSSQIEIDPYDEKSQMQLSLYGVPMYSLSGVSVPTPPAASTVQQTTIDPLTGLDSAAIGASVEFTADGDAAAQGYYSIADATLSNGGISSPAAAGLEASDGNPIQPKFTADVTAPSGSDLIARGAVIESLTSREADLDDPTIARAVVDNTVIETPSDSGVLIFPTAFATVHTEQTPNGPRGKLVVVPAQYNSTDANEQLLIDSFDVRTYYAPSTSPDVVRPQFSDVSALGVPGAGALPDLLLRASVSDPGTPGGSNGVFSTGVRRVLIQYFDGRDWFPVEMFPANAARTEWSGGLPGKGAGGVFFVQAVDGAGNVSATANKGQNYLSGGEPAEAVAFVTGPQGENGWYLGAADVELKGASVGVDTHTVAINGVPRPGFYTAPFTLDTQGQNTVVITGPGATPIQLVVPVDTQEPTVDLETPIAVLSAGNAFGSPVVEKCEDPTPGSGLRDLDLASESNCEVTTAQYSLEIAGEPDVGPFTLASVRGQDIAGNESTESQSAVILSGVEGEGDYYTTPVILGVLGAAALDATIQIGAEPSFAYVEPIRIAATASVVVTIGDDVFRFPVRVDADAPTIELTAPAGPFEIGEVVVLTCEFADTGGSGLASAACGSTVGTYDAPTDDATLAFTIDTSELVVDRVVSVSVADKAGNEATATYTYSVTDQQDPTATADVADLTFVVGTPVTVTCTFTDAGGSGLASVACGDTAGDGLGTLTDTFTPTFGNRTFEVSATDNAGNATTTIYNYTAVDKTPPTVDTNIDELAFEFGEPVTVNCAFADSGGSGLAAVVCGSTTASGAATLTDTFTPTVLGLQSFVASASDGAGNTTLVTLDYRVVDSVAPTATVTPLPDGAYGRNELVQVTCTFGDGTGSGLASVRCGPVVGTDAGTLRATVDTSTLGAKTFVVSAIDNDGNETSTAFDYTVVDRTKPTASVTPTPGGAYEQGQIVPLTCTYADEVGGSGLATVRCGSAVGTADGTLSVNLDTSTTGSNTFVVSATDAAGNTTTTSYPYTVVDPLCDPRGDAAQPKGDIIRCAAQVNGNGTATISITVDGTIANDGTQYRLRLATSPSSSGTQVKWAAGKISGTPLRSARINPGNPSQLDFVIDLAKVGSARGTKLYWRAEVQNGTKDPGVGFLDMAPNSGFFVLQT